MAVTTNSERPRAPQTPGARPSATIIAFPPRPARPVAPPFDHNNPAHVAAWEALFAFGLSQMGGH